VYTFFVVENKLFKKSPDSELEPEPKFLGTGTAINHNGSTTLGSK
jgi:hypothetical protein